MDAQSETWRFKALLLAAMIFVVSGFYAYSELLYLIAGRDADATITQTSKVKKRSRFGLNRGEQVYVEYQFTDADGNQRSGSARAGDDWGPPADNKVAVRYRPGPDGSSRLAGRIGWIVLVIFGAALASVGFFGYRLWREANNAYAKPKARGST